MNCNTKLKTIFYITKRPTFFVKCKIQNEGEAGIKDIKEFKEFNEADRKHELH